MMTRAQVQQVVAVAARSLYDAVDLPDVFLGVGVALAWYGGAKVSWPWSCVAVGVFLIGLSVVGVRPTGEKR